jgi:hypothetical protein
MNILRVVPGQLSGQLGLSTKYYLVNAYFIDLLLHLVAGCITFKKGYSVPFPTSSPDFCPFSIFMRHLLINTVLKTKITRITARSDTTVCGPDVPELAGHHFG